MARRVLHAVMVCLATAGVAAASAGLDLARTRLETGGSGSKLHVVLKAPLADAGSFVGEVVDARGNALATCRVPLADPGSPGPVVCPLGALDRLEDEVAGDLVWARLRWRVERGEEDAPVAEGVVPLAAVAPDAFTLDLVTGGWAYLGGAVPVRVVARHALARSPLGGVAVEVRLGAPFPGSPPPQELTTSRDGAAACELGAPPPVGEGEIEVVAVARRGPFVQRVAQEVLVGDRTEVAVATDKVLYQPGQVVHFRALLLASDRHALPAATVEFTITDEENRVQLEQRGTTSAHGLANGEWEIPEGAALGSYELEVAVADFPGNRDVKSGVDFEVARYELPTMRVRAASDRPYYLPGEDAVVTVSVLTLAGDPVAGAEVTVWEEEPGGSWSWSADADDEDDEDALLWRGRSDAAGRCRVPVSLAEAHADLADDDWCRFRDLGLRIRATDAVSGRSVLGRARLRATREPLHVFLRVGFSGADLPSEIFVTTFTADGVPVPAQVELRAAESGALLATTETTPMGIGVVEIAPPDEHEVVATAVDQEGRRGSGHEWISRDDTPVLRVVPDAVFHVPGAPLHVTITGSVSSARVVVEVGAGDRLLSSQVVRLEDRRAEVTLPWDDRMAGEVSVSAYYAPANPVEVLEAVDDGYHGLGASRALLVVPDRQALALALDAAPVTARPGDTVVLRMRSSAGGHGGEPAALGLAVVDTGVEELLVQRGDEDAVSSFLRQTERGVFGWYEESFAGIRRRDLATVDPEHVPPGLELVARLLLPGYDLRLRAASEPGERLEALYGPGCRELAEPALTALRVYADACDALPQDPGEAEAVLATLGSPLASLHDAWGRRLFARTVVRGDRRVVRLVSPGPDGEAGTGDDVGCGEAVRHWFAARGAAAAEALRAHHRATGEWIVRPEELAAELAGGRWDDAAPLDPWRHPVRLELAVDGSVIRMKVRSPGPDGVFATPPDGGYARGDDVVAWSGAVDTFDSARPWVESALLSWLAGGHPFPTSADELVPALRRLAIEPGWLTDPRGRPYVFRFGERAAYRDRVATHADAEGQRIEAVPELRVEPFVEVRAVGADGIAGTADDRSVHTFASGWFRTMAAVNAVGGADASVHPAAPPSVPEVAVDEAHGAILGRVLDEGRQPLPGVTVLITGAGVSAERTTNADGLFAVRLQPGLYTLVLSLPGFDRLELAVSVTAGESTTVEAVLSGTFAEEVMVTAEAPMVETTATAVGVDALETTQGAPSRPGGTAPRPPVSTPRLRRDFPETLLWVPELLTGSDGRASLELPLADAVTTWKVEAVASTVDGRLATAELPVVAALPFYLEPDLPPVLTVGDRLRLPVVLRNFTDQELGMALGLEAGAGLAAEGGPEGRVVVPARTSVREAVPLRAVAPVGTTSVMVSAASGQAGDAVERPTRVVPYGEEVTRTSGGLLGGGTLALPLSVPAEAIPGTAAARLTVYPNLGAQLLDAMAGLQRRPAGCAEQITALAWTSLLYLELTEEDGGTDEARTAARRRVDEAVRALGRLQTAGGGFGFWRGDEPDITLTAHVVRFLGRATAATQVDPTTISRAVAWLAGRVGDDGRLQEHDRRRAATQLQDTAFVLRALAETPAADPEVAERARGAVARGLDALTPLVEAFDEPHLLASYVLTCRTVGRAAPAEAGARRLAQLARSESGTTYWRVHLNTPLAGWGLPGRLESTALAALALAGSGPEHRQLVDGAVRFLLRHRDGAGAWFSTATTTAVAETLALRALVSGGAAASVTVRVGGREVRHVVLPAGSSNPAVVDLTGQLGPGGGEVEVSGGGAGLSSAELVTRWFVPWEGSGGTQSRGNGLELTVDCGPRVAAVGDAVTCSVHAARTAEQGFGMLLAEVGLPPGAEVDRRSLEEGLRGLWGSFEVRPDRVVLYLWPPPEGADVRFTFTPRMAGETRSASSLLYDYYNPTARVVVPPWPFTVREKAR